MTAPPRTRRVLHALAAASWWLVPAACAVVLLAPSLIGRAVLVPADILTTALPWAALAEEGTRPSNPLLRDLIDTYHPESVTIWERLTGPGDPAWLEGAGMGGPGWWFIGSGALSPFLWPAAMIGVTGAWGLGGALRIAVAGAGIGLLARSWGVSRAGATVAAASFALSGFVIGWLGWPQSHVAATVGWVWWAVRRTARRDAPPWAVAVLAVATAASWLGGFPAIAAILGVTAAGLAIAESFADGGDRLRGVARCACGLVAGTLLAAVQLVPSLAYLDAVDLAARAEAWRGSLPVHMLVRWVAPDVFGNNVDVAYWGRINLVETAASIGLPALVLAGCAVLWAARPPAVLRAGSLAVATGALAYGFPPLLQVLRVLPGLSTNPPARTIVLTSAAVALLAGLGLDAVRDPARRVDRRGVLALSALGAVIAVALVVVRPDLEIATLAADRLTTDEARATAAGIARASLLRALVVTAAVCAAIAVLRRLPVDAAWPVVGALVVVVVLDPFTAAVGWNPQRPPGELYPPVASLAALAEEVPPPARVAGPPGVLLPMTDLRYGFTDARGRRFVTVDQRALIEAAGGTFSSPTRWDLDPDPSAWTPALGAMGVGGVVLAPGAPVPPVPALGPATDPSPPLLAGEAVTVTVEAAGEVHGVVVRVGTSARRNEGDLRATVASGDAEATGSVAVAPLIDGQLVEVSLDGPVPVDGPVEVTLEGTATDPGRAVALFGEGAQVAVSLRTEAGWQAVDLGELRVGRVPDATPWLSVPPEVRATPREQIPTALAGAREPDVVHLQPADADVAVGAAEVLEAHVDGRQVMVTLDAPEGAVLRLLEADLPGWTATVDGAVADVVTADGAFVAVIVPPGGEEVSLTWRAPGLMTGTWLSALALAGLLAWTAAASTGDRRTRARRP